MELKQKENLIRIAILVAVTMAVIALLAMCRVYYNVYPADEEQAIPAIATEASPEPTPVPTPRPTPKPTPKPTLEPTPMPGSEKDDLLLLVNPWNALPEDYEVELQMVDDEQFVDVRCAQALLDMVQGCQDAGGSPLVCSTYRTMEKQQYLFNNKIRRLVEAGMNTEEAPTVAAMSVARPGTSEHQLGLAVDIIDRYYTNLDRGQEWTYTQSWLMENSWQYGFILRYPNEKSHITGIIYEPWHYRYVGLEAAQEMYEQGLTLEEYLGRIDSGADPVAVPEPDTAFEEEYAIESDTALDMELSEFYDEAYNTDVVDEYEGIRQK